MIGRLLEPKEKRSETISGMSLSDLWGLFNRSGTTAAGVSVTEDVARGSSAWFAAFDINSNAVASSIFSVYKLIEGGAERAYDHPVYPLIHDEPNERMTAFDFAKLMADWPMSWGNALAEIERRRNGEVVAYWPIHPSRSGPPKRVNGRLVYQVLNDDGTSVLIDAQNMIHIKGFSKDGVWGIGLIGLAREAIGAAVSAEQYGARFFSNDARPSVIIEIPGGPDDELVRQIKESWVNQHGGEKRGGVGIIHSGMKATPFGVNQQDAQYIETRRNHVLDAARFTGTPPHMLGEMDRATHSNIEHEEIAFVTRCVLPRAKAIEQEFTRKSFTREEKKTFYCKFDLKGLLRGDFKTRQEGLHFMLFDGVINPDEWRALEEMNPIPDGKGKTYRVPVNTTPAISPDEAQTIIDITPDAIQAKQQGQDTGNRKRIDAMFLDLLTPAVARLARVESDKATRAMKRPTEYLSWLDKFAKEHRDRVRAELEPVVNAYCEIRGATPTITLIDTIVDYRMECMTKTLRGAEPEAIVKSIAFDAGLLFGLLTRKLDEGSNEPDENDGN